MTKICSNYTGWHSNYSYTTDGDDTRRMGPPFINGESAAFLGINRGKRSISIDLCSEQGKALFLDLVECADVVMENFTAGTMGGLGLGYDVLAARNPRLIYAATSGFGQSGPLKEKPALDIVIQGMGGVMSITGYPDSPPARPGMSLGDITAGLEVWDPEPVPEDSEIRNLPNAFVTTHLAGATGLLGWMAIEWIRGGRPTVLGACTGGVAGLACITPACGSVTPLSGLVIGLLAGVICFVMCTNVKNRFGFDDSLDVFGVHGTSGVLGLLMAGVLASPAVTGELRFNGLVHGGTGQFINQVVGILATAALAVVGTLLLLLLVRATIGLRVDPDGEREGLDLNQHGEEGYIFL